MNPSLFGVLAAVVLSGLWLTTRRRPQPFLRSGDTRAVAALNRAQIALVTVRDSCQPFSQDVEAGSEPEIPCQSSAAALAFGPLPPVGAVRQRLALLRQLDGWSRGSAAERRQAMALARSWGHPSALPLLRRGLRDPDPLVMAEAAAAMQAFRGRSQGQTSQLRSSRAQRQASDSDPSGRPRKVRRTR